MCICVLIHYFCCESQLNLYLCLFLLLKSIEPVFVYICVMMCIYGNLCVFMCTDMEHHYRYIDWFVFNVQSDIWIYDRLVFNFESDIYSNIY